MVRRKKRDHEETREAAEKAPEVAESPSKNPETDEPLIETEELEESDEKPVETHEEELEAMGPGPEEKATTRDEEEAAWREKED